MKTAVVAFLLALTATEASLRSEFAEWKKAHGKVYASAADEELRFTVWQFNLARVQEQQSMAAQPGSGLEGQFGMSFNADMTPQEFHKQYLMCHKAQPRDRSLPREFYNFNAPIPDSFDWREKGAVTPVKDQGQCGSCWAFSTTGTTEAAHFIAKGQLVSLSEQDLVDCSHDHYNDGCDGGRVDWALQYIVDKKGISTEATYPYEARDGTCRRSKATIGATVSAYAQVQEFNETALMAAIATIGPVGVAIDVTDAFANYKSGVFYDRSCKGGEFDLDHAVLAVGYGTLNGQAYWIVKNSWGGSWGNQGFILMSRNRSNNCGIATNAYYPKGAAV